MEEFKTLEEQKHRFNLLKEELKLLEKQKETLRSQIRCVEKQIECVDVFYEDIEVVITPEMFEKYKEERYGYHRDWEPYKKIISTKLMSPLTFKIRKDIDLEDNDKVFYYIDRNDNGLPDNTYTIEKDNYPKCTDINKAIDCLMDTLVDWIEYEESLKHDKKKLEHVLKMLKTNFKREDRVNDL